MIAMRSCKIILSVIISFYFGADIPAHSALDSIHALPEFRNIKWDSSLEDVREQETAYYLQTFSGFGVEALSYKGEVAGLDARIDYTFRNDKFNEGSYAVITKDNFSEDFLTLLNFIKNNHGEPEYRLGPHYTSSSVWIKINDYGMFLGPSYYWVFRDGFICLVSQKFKQEITLSILYVYGLTIEEYNAKNSVEWKNFKIIRLNR